MTYKKIQNWLLVLFFVGMAFGFIAAFEPLSWQVRYGIIAALFIPFIISVLKIYHRLGGSND